MMKQAWRLATAAAVLAAAGATAAAQDERRPVFGACGGTITGYDGQSYPCDRDRQAVCDAATNRCVCLERRSCGGRQDEPF